MKQKIRRNIFFSTAALVTVLALILAWLWATRNPSGLSLRSLAETAGHGYVFGYPLVLMHETRQVTGEAATTVTVNALHHVRNLPDAGFTAVVRPNMDTLYSVAWLDLAAGPQLLEIPPMNGRYWLFQGLDAWTNVVADPGVRTAGDSGGRFLFVGPDWTGPGRREPALEGATVYRSPTRMLWLLGRIEVDGRADLAAVHALQDTITLTAAEPLETTHTEPVPAARRTAREQSLPPPERLRLMDVRIYFDRLAALMQDDPPSAKDEPMLERLAGIDVAAGNTPDWSAFGPLALAAIRRGVDIARGQLAEGPPQQSGWMTPESHIGRYATDYAYRAGVARYGLGANPPEDALYPSTITDVTGAPLVAGGRYRIRFGPAELPPVDGFWSITLYDASGYLVANSANRHAITSRDDLVIDKGGGVTLDLHPGPPAPGREANWLPTPAAVQGQNNFNLLGRLYWPQERALADEWSMPPVVRVD